MQDYKDVTSESELPMHGLLGETKIFMTNMLILSFPLKYSLQKGDHTEASYNYQWLVCNLY